METQSVQLNDLPDEILLMIFKKLNNTELLYSLMGANAHLNRLLHDPIFTSHLTLVWSRPNRSIRRDSTPKYLVYSLPETMLNRFCSYILREIHKKVRWLDLEPTSIERIIRATHYPDLFGVGLHNIKVEAALHLFSNEHYFTSVYKNQILSLIIDTNTNREIFDVYLNTNTESVAVEHGNSLLLLQILTIFTNLRKLYFGLSELLCQYLSFKRLPSNSVSSTLLELHVCVTNFNDCLYLLDRCLEQLRLFHVVLFDVCASDAEVKNKDKLPNLRSFILHCSHPTEHYHDLVLPLLYRMPNLETLDLHLTLWTDRPFVDGNHLKTNIINHMQSLKKFTFNIRSYTYFYKKNNVPSHEGIQQTFEDFKNEQIISIVEYRQRNQASICHIYSLPYQWKSYNALANSFPGGLFVCVRRVSLSDDRPFEHEFFYRISQSFPFMEQLHLDNRKPQKNKQTRKSKKNENEVLPIIQYPYLMKLRLNVVHEDYYEEFLFDTKTCLPNNIRVEMDYKLVRKVTRNFRRNTTRNNCAKVGEASFRNVEQFPQHIIDYFPNANIC